MSAAKPKPRIRLIECIGCDPLIDAAHEIMGRMRVLSLFI
jgi:hypothetical protein